MGFKRRVIDGHVVQTDVKTSERLARIRQKDTSPELAVRRILTDLGHSYRVRNRDLPGSPDIANRRRNWTIFVHGCYWHRHSGCVKSTTPKRNRAFWMAKFEANVRRDRKRQRELRQLGYRVLVVWECETQKDVSRLQQRLRDFFDQ